MAYFASKKFLNAYTNIKLCSTHIMAYRRTFPFSVSRFCLKTDFARKIHRTYVERIPSHCT